MQRIGRGNDLHDAEAWGDYATGEDERISVQELFARTRQGTPTPRGQHPWTRQLREDPACDMQLRSLLLRRLCSESSTKLFGILAIRILQLRGL